MAVNLYYPLGIGAAGFDLKQSIRFPFEVVPVGFNTICEQRGANRRPRVSLEWLFLWFG